MKKVVMTVIFLVLAGLVMYSDNSWATSCHGTEPFWSADIKNDQIVLNEIEKKTVLHYSQATAAEGMKPEFLKVFSDKRGPVAVLISASCNNGMSDEMFPQQFVLFLGNKTLFGCCGKPIAQ